MEYKKCRNCGHIWAPIKEDPMYCPRCHVTISERGRQRKRSYYKQLMRKSYMAVTTEGKRITIKTTLKRPRPEGCELCAKRPNKLDYHHWDNSDLSRGMWLCYLCHRGAEASDKGLVEKYLKLRAQIEAEPKGVI